MKLLIPIIFFILIFSNCAAGGPKNTASFSDIIKDMEADGVMNKDEKNLLTPYIFIKLPYKEWVGIIEGEKQRSADKDQERIERMLSFLRKSKDYETDARFTSRDIYTSARKNKAITDKEFKERIAYIKQKEDNNAYFTTEYDYDNLISLLTKLKEDPKNIETIKYVSPDYPVIITVTKVLLTKVINYAKSKIPKPPLTETGYPAPLPR